MSLDGIFHAQENLLRDFVRIMVAEEEKDFFPLQVLSNVIGWLNLYHLFCQAMRKFTPRKSIWFSHWKWAGY